ncbi:MAG: hypothetical protein WC224_08065 [Sphaerochaetaceae bacterium]
MFKHWAILVTLLLIGTFLVSCQTASQIDEYIYRSNAAASYAEASEILNQGLKRWPSSERLLYNAAIVEAYQGEFSTAIETLKTLNILSEEANVKYLKALAGVALAADNRPLALESYHKVLALDPLDSTVRFKVVDLLSATQEYSEAYNLVYEAYLNGDFSEEVINSLAELTVLLGKTENPWEIIRDL